MKLTLGTKPGRETVVHINVTILSGARAHHSVPTTIPVRANTSRVITLGQHGIMLRINSIFISVPSGAYPLMKCGTVATVGSRDGLSSIFQLRLPLASQTLDDLSICLFFGISPLLRFASGQFACCSICFEVLSHPKRKSRLAGLTSLFRQHESLM
jgi:hypothetical protein